MNVSPVQQVGVNASTAKIGVNVSTA